MVPTYLQYIEENHIGFKKLENKIENSGKSKESAEKITAAIGIKKYGKKKMSAAHSGKPLKEESSDNLQSAIRMKEKYNQCQCHDLEDDPKGLECYTCGRMVKVPKGTPVFNLESQKLED